MQTYKQLLLEFHSEQASIIQDDNHIQYIQLLNSLKINKDKQIQTRNKHSFEFSRLKFQNQDIMNSSYLEKSLQLSKIVQIQDNFKEKKSLIELQKESLLQEIDHTITGFQKVKMQKEIVQTEIKMIDKKQIEISAAICESSNNIQELRALIKHQKQTNDKEFYLYDIKLEELKEKLQKVNQQNVLNSKYYKHLTTTKTQNKNNNLLGSILSWQNEQSKIKKLPKKIYTKNQIESMLRTLFLLNKFSQLNFGNIIEHLIKISDPNNQKFQQSKSKKNIFLDKKGQEIEVKQLILRLESQLLTNSECKFLSKTKIIEFYARKGVIISSDWETNNLSKQTFQLIQKVVLHFQKLTSWFSRIQKRNSQLSEYYCSLQKIDENLQNQIKSIQDSAAQKSINYLQLREQQIETLHDQLHGSCKVIFLFNINMHDLIHRFQNLNKFFDKIVKSTNRKTYKKTFIEFEQDTNFLKRITKILFKSPQCIILDWNNVIKRVKTESSFMTTGQMFENMPQNQIYFETIMKNDLLRIYAEPSMFEKNKSYIDNLHTTFEYVISEESEIIIKLCSILQELLLFSKNGIKQFQGYKIQRCQQKKKQAQMKDKQTNDKLNPLLKILQQSEFKMDKFFKQDGVKQEDKHSEHQGFCVESSDFFRRDNFKLIQKLQKINMKKRGLLVAVPFAVNTSLQLQASTRKNNNISYERQTSRLGSTRNSYRRRQPRLSHELNSTRHNLLSQRRQKQNSRKKDLKVLLKNISNIASQNQKYRIRKKMNSQQHSFSMSASKIWTNRSKLE